MAPGRSATGRSLGVEGPQLGYYYPEIVYQEQLQGPGIDAQGVAASGIGLYLLIGRTKNYAWSLTSADNANEDVFAEKLCVPGGGTPTRATLSYVFRGRCRPMSIFDAGRLGNSEITFPMTVHGPVIGTATVHGWPYALTRKRSTYGQDVLSLAALKAMTEGRATTPQKFWKFANRFGFTFNWGYINRTATSFFSSGKLPIRAPGLDRMLPTLGTGSYEWRGFLPELAHPHDVGGPNNLLLNWNNKAAPGWMHGDDGHFGSVQHVELFGPFPRRPRINDVVGVMNKAATQNAAGVLAWPVIRAMLRRAKAPDSQTAGAVKLIDNWVRAGSPTVGSPAGGPIPYPGAALFQTAWPHIFAAVMGARLGNLLGAVRKPARHRSFLRRQGPRDGARAPRPRPLLRPLLRARQRARLCPLAVGRDTHGTFRPGEAVGSERFSLAHRPGHDLVRAQSHPDHVPHHQPSHLSTGDLLRAEAVDASGARHAARRPEGRALL